MKNLLKRIRALFKTVYCEDCENCILNMAFNSKDEQLRYATCKAFPIARDKMTHRGGFKEQLCCNVAHKFSFCFKFKAKAGE